MSVPSHSLLSLPPFHRCFCSFLTSPDKVPPTHSSPPPPHTHTHSRFPSPTPPRGGVIQVALLGWFAAVFPSDLVLHLLHKVPHVISTRCLPVQSNNNNKREELVEELGAQNITVLFPGSCAREEGTLRINAHSPLSSIPS